MGRGTRLEAYVEAGEVTFTAWNPLREDAGEPPESSAMTAQLAPQMAYFVVQQIGGWDAHGPGMTVATERRRGTTRTVYTSHEATLVVLRPRSASWSDFAEAMCDMIPLDGDSVAGQRWLDDKLGSFNRHRAIARKPKASYAT